MKRVIVLAAVGMLRCDSLLLVILEGRVVLRGAIVLLWIEPGVIAMVRVLVRLPSSVVVQAILRVEYLPWTIDR